MTVSKNTAGQTGNPETTTEGDRRDKRASIKVAVAVALFLLLLQAMLIGIALFFWLWAWRLWGDRNLITWEQFVFIKTMVYACCASGIGGSFFMVRELYIKYCFGREKKDETGKVIGVEYFETDHFLRYTLLPICSVVMGVFVYFAFLAGSLVFRLASEEGTRHPFASNAAIILACFLAGFTFHDTLNKFRELSSRLLRLTNGR